MSLAPRSASPSSRPARRLSSVARRSVAFAPVLLGALAMGMGCGSAGDFSTASGVDASVGDGGANANANADAGGDSSTGTNVVAPPPTGTSGQMDGGDASTVPPITVVDAGSLSAVDCSEVADISAIFVSQTSGVADQGSDPTKACGDRSPCTTITAGLAAVSASRNVIYIDKGMYNEALTLKAGVTLRGGWQLFDAVWSPICDPSRVQAVTVTAPSSTNKTITAVDLGGTATVMDMVVVSKPTASTGESIYGIFATGSTTTLALQDVSVSVAGGGNGANGTMGSAGDPTICESTGTDGTPGTNGAAGSGASAAQYDQNGQKITNATSGASGTAGEGGQIGADGPTCETITPPAPRPVPNCDPATDGTGCSCQQVTGTPFKSCGQPGPAGCGGAPGGPGGFGGNGGSSIALFAYQATVTLLRGSLTAGNGGNGGNGAAGGAGAPPAMNYVAQPGPGYTECKTKGTGKTATCGCAGNYGGAVAPSGSPGGAGGAGGGGGGGTGGDSYAIYSSTHIVAGSATLNPGTAGAPGTGASGGSNGAAGQVGMEN